MKNILFNPFERYAGWQSVLIGSVIVVFTAILASVGNIHLDGVLDLHMGAGSADASVRTTVALCLAEGLINWLSMVFFIFISGLLFSASKIRFVDVLGTQGMARFPYLIAVIVNTVLYNEKIILYLQSQVLRQGQQIELSASDIISFAVTALLSLLMRVWMVQLMYKAYCVSCNMKGQKAILTFIFCLILAEILSKLLLNYLI
jgi:hypothetical protein